jgi:hypothetical protein
MQQGWPDEFHVLYEDDGCLMDRYALAAWAEVSVRTVQRRCTAVGSYKGRAMYDRDECARVLFPPIGVAS